MSDPITYPAGQSGTPYVTVDNAMLLEIHWPDPRPEWFPMSSDLFASLVDEINSYRRRGVQMSVDIVALADEFSPGSFTERPNA